MAIGFAASIDELSSSVVPFATFALR